MPTVTLNYGVSPITVDCQRAGQAAPRRAGDKTLAFLGAEDSNYRGEFMVIPLVLAPKSPADAAAIRALIALGAQFPCRGDVFLNGGATTVVCSGKISDDLDQTASWVTINLTLYEVGSAAGYTPATISLYLTHAAAGGGAFVASTDPADDVSGVFGSVTIMDAPEVIPTCGGAPNPAIHCTVGFSTNPEATWESLPAPAAGLMVGAPYVLLLSRGGTGDRWYTQAVKYTVTLVRSGVDVLTFDTDYSNGNGGFAGSTIYANAPASIVWSVQAGDTLRVDSYGRAGLNSGYANDGVYQVITFGNIGGAAHTAAMVYRGTALFQ